MKFKIFALFASMIFSAEAFALTVEEAQVKACAEASRINFQFDGSCEDEFNQPLKITPEIFVFQGFDVSGDCVIRVSVLRENGNTVAQTYCE